jgi:hypothetical protein
MPESQSSLIATLALITKAIDIGGDILPVALRAYAALKADHTDEEFTKLAREANNLDEQKILHLIELAAS